MRTKEINIDDLLYDALDVMNRSTEESYSARDRYHMRMTHAEVVTFMRIATALETIAQALSRKPPEEK